MIELLSGLIALLVPVVAVLVKMWISNRAAQEAAKKAAEDNFKSEEEIKRRWVEKNKQVNEQIKKQQDASKKWLE